MKGEHRLRVVRKARNLTAADLAKEMGVSKATISRIERGHCDPSMQLARKLCAFFKDDGLVAHDFMERAA